METRAHTFCGPSTQPTASKTGTVPANGVGTLGDHTFLMVWFFKQFNKFAFKSIATDRFVAAKGNGILRANFMPKADGWRTNKEVFQVEWEPSVDTERQRTQCASSFHLVGPFALKAANGRYLRVLEEDEEHGVMAVSIDLPNNPRRRSEDELFGLELVRGHLFALRNVKTGRYLWVEAGSDNNGTVSCHSQTISHNALFRLNLKVGFRTLHRLFVGVSMGGYLVPGSRKIEKRETFMMQLEAEDKFSIVTSTGRFWKVEKNGIITAKSHKIEGSPEEYWLLKRHSSSIGSDAVVYYIESFATRQVARTEESQKLVVAANIEDSSLFTLVLPSSLPSNNSSMFSMFDVGGWWAGQRDSGGESSSDNSNNNSGRNSREDISLRSPNEVAKLTHASDVVQQEETGNNKAELEEDAIIQEGEILGKIKGRIQGFAKQLTEQLPAKRREVTLQLLAGERIVMQKDHILQITPVDAALGTAVLTNYRLIFMPDSLVTTPSNRGQAS
eukprot:TRINITY_DN4421_c1_g1_i1.p1 TRINITY_DN4421_c1_g1~~TRINITY_DN4421_c1_g1_i1.p1  ORF type:complete len:501 (-),score=74.97 TRINITY_DN4421_c1_g1_i1:648-2150(-)